MTKQTNKLGTLINKASGNRKLYVFLSCLFLATFFWVLNSLSHQYSADIVCNVKYKNQPEGKIILNKLPKQFHIKVKGLGFDLLAHKLSLGGVVVEIDLKRISTKSQINKPYSYTISSMDYASFISNQLGDKIEVKNIYPDSISFVIDKAVKKQLKILPTTQISFKKQYQLFGDIILKPAITEVVGPKSILDTLNEIKTSLLKYDGLSETVTETVSFSKEYKQLKIAANPSKVLVHIPVEEYTESTKKVIIAYINVPDSVQLKTIPKEIDVKFQLPLSKLASLPSAEFRAEVDYSKIKDSFSHMLKVNLVQQPDYIQNITLTPSKVEYIIKK